MKNLLFLVLTIFVTLALPASGQVGWKDDKGHIETNTDSRKSVNGFGGWVLVTSDANWRAKWKTPSSSVPSFTEAKTVAKGQQVYVLAFFSNPLLDNSGDADVTCDLDITRPDGTSSLHQTDVSCFKGKIKESANHLFLSAPVIGFTREAGDKVGKWVVRIALKDNVRGTVVPLSTSFVLK